MFKMKITFFLFLLLSVCTDVKAYQQCDSVTLSLMEGTWHKFREIHPFCFQTIGLKHYGDTCIFVMSEPAEWVSVDTLRSFFAEYDGSLIIGRKSFGYDGGLYDAIGFVKLDSAKFEGFENKLYEILYPDKIRNKKNCYTDLDHPTSHVYFFDYGKYENVIPFDLQNTLFTTKDGEQSLEKLMQIKNYPPCELFYSKQGYVVWRINAHIQNSLLAFLLHFASQFALDTDLIIKLFFKDDAIYIVGRKRMIPFAELPPLRTETIKLLLTLKDDELSLCFNPDSATIVSIKDSVVADSVWATPVCMSKRLQNTELGNLMILSTILLNSWSNRSKVKDLFVNYPPLPDYLSKYWVMYYLSCLPKYLRNIDERLLLDGFIKGVPDYHKKQNSALFDVSMKSYRAGICNTDLTRLAQYMLLFRAFRPLMLLRFQFLLMRPDSDNSKQWIQTPSFTVSNVPWSCADY